MSASKLGQAILGDVSATSDKPRKSDQTRQDILETALEFLWTRSFRELSIRELMSHTGSSRSAFYQYFSDLYELIETLLRSLALDIFEAAAPWFHSVGPPEPLLEESLRGLVQICYERGPKPPQGYENNWLETVPGKSWFVALRVYGPLEPWIGKTWRLSEVALLE